MSLLAWLRWLYYSLRLERWHYDLLLKFDPRLKSEEICRVLAWD